MASLLQKSTPWIEDSFVYACSFDASRCCDDNASDEDDDFNDDEEIMEPQTQNTIPDGLHDDDDDDDSRDGNNIGRRNKPPPSRGGKIVQIIDRGGDANFYVNTQQQQQQQTSNDNNTNDCCPPYLILHDGQYSTIAFLSEEAYNSSMMRGARRPRSIPKKSLISISQYTISTIKCCTQQHSDQQQHHHHQQSNNNNNNNENNADDMLTLQLVRPDMPQPHLSQIQSSLNTNLLLCLYLLGPITLIGAENQGLIGNTINVNCSIKVRRVLLSHMAQFERVHDPHVSGVCVNTEREEEEEDYQHWTMVQRLEACHCYYQLLKERQGGVIPMWPWESRLVDGDVNDDEENDDDDGENEDEVASNDPSNDEPLRPAATTTATATATVASPGRVERMIRKYDNLEEFLHEEEEEDGDDTADVGDKRAGRASTGTYLTKWDSEEDQLEEEEGEEEEEVYEKEKIGNTGEQAQQQQEEEKIGGEEEKEKDDAAPIEQGNVAELFDNFEDINDVLDLDEDVSVSAEEGEASSPANAMLDSNENDDDNIDSENVAGNVAAHDQDNEATAETNNTQDDNVATFVGIDQMIVDEDDDEEEEEEEEEEEDNDELAPLLTQQEFDTYKNEETGPASDILQPPQELTESQIPLPPTVVNKQSTKLSKGDGHTNEYVESQLPLPPPKYTQSSDEENGDDIGTESQIPFPSRRKQQNAQSSDESASEDEENDGDNGTESQIPFPSQRKQQAQALSRHTDDEERMYAAESQVLIPQKQPAKNALSPRKPNVAAANISIAQPDRPKRRKDVIVYDSDDDWMRVRKVKPSAKPTKTSPRVQSQMAGEGSEEIIPTNNLLDTSQIIDNDENEPEEEDSAGIPEKEIQQPGSTSTAQKEPTSSVATERSLLPKHNVARPRNTADHRVRFAMDNSDQHSQHLPAAPVPPTHQRELFISVSNKASKILLQSTKSSNKPATRKRKASEDEGETKNKKEFSFGTIFDRAKRLFPPHPDDSEV